MLAEIMSEVTEAPVIIQPAKSEDKLEIEKEEAGETPEKVEDVVGEKAEGESAEKAASESDEKVAEDDGKTEEKPAAAEGAESSEVTEEEKKEEEEGDNEKVEGASEEQKDSEEVQGEKKKFSLSQIKTPKIIKEIRSRSKSRDKKKVREVRKKSNVDHVFNIPPHSHQMRIVLLSLLCQISPEIGL